MHLSVSELKQLELLKKKSPQERFSMMLENRDRYLFLEDLEKAEEMLVEK